MTFFNLFHLACFVGVTWHTGKEGVGYLKGKIWVAEQVCYDLSLSFNKNKDSRSLDAFALHYPYKKESSGSFYY